MQGLLQWGRDNPLGTLLIIAVALLFSAWLIKQIFRKDPQTDYDRYRNRYSDQIFAIARRERWLSIADFFYCAGWVVVGVIFLPDAISAFNTGMLMAALATGVLAVGLIGFFGFMLAVKTYITLRDAVWEVQYWLHPATGPSEE